MELGARLREKEFLLRKGSVFLNNGSYGAVPRRLLQHQARLREESESHPDTWYRRTNPAKHRESLETLGEFIGTDPNNLVFVENVTTGLQSVVTSLKLSSSDTVLISNWTYHSMKVILKHLASQDGGPSVAEVEFSFPIKSKDHIVQTYREFLDSFDKKVRLVIIDHITSPTSVLVPLRELCELFRDRGILTLVDGAHCCGQIPMDVDSYGADFYTGNVHKWLLTPRGCAYLWVHPRFHDRIRPALVSHFHGVQFHYDFCVRGTRDDTPYHCVQQAVRFFNDLGGWKAVTSHNKGLLEAGLARLEKSWDTRRLPVPDDVRAPFMALIKVPDMDNYESTIVGASDLETDLFNLYDVTVLCMPVAGALYIRLSIHVYNSMADIERLESAILELKSKKGQKKPKGYLLPIMHWDLSSLKFESNKLNKL